jgi:hypothetical protein
MTLPSSVLSAIRFWDTESSPSVTWNITGISTSSWVPGSVSLSDQAAILDALDTLYSGSTTFSTLVDTYVLGGGLLRFGSNSGVDGGRAFRPGPSGSFDPYVIIDTSDIANIHYFNQEGLLVSIN